MKGNDSLVLCTPNLFGIPRELQDKIYHYLLVKDKPIILGKAFAGDPGAEHSYEYPGLLLASRQLR